MGGAAATVTVGRTTYRVHRGPGADWATLEGSRGGLVHAREVQEGFVWRLWRGRQDTVGWAVEDGPVGLRVVSEDLAGWLLRLGRPRPDLEELLKAYAREGRRDAFDLAVELIQTQALNEALPSDDLRRTIDLLLG